MQNISPFNYVFGARLIVVCLRCLCGSLCTLWPMRMCVIEWM